MSDIPGSTQPGDSKSTADKLGEDVKAVGHNIQGTAAHYDQKTGASDKAAAVTQNISETAATYADKADAKSAEHAAETKSEGGSYLQQAQDTAAAIGKNIQDTAAHYGIGQGSTGGTAATGTAESQGVLAQAQGLVASALDTTSKAASDLASSISGAGKK